MNAVDKALSIVHQKRLNAELIAKQNREKALQNKDFALSYKEYMNEVISQAKQGNFNKNLEKTKQNLDLTLKKLNIGEIEPKYSCTKCNDNGYIDGKQCDCLKQEINKILTQESGFGELIDFKNVKFDIFENQELMKKIYQKLEAWCNSDFKKKMVFLSGGTGTGKTYLLKCMANELIKRRKLTTLVTAYRLSQDCLKSHACRDIYEKEAIISRYLESEVLFIDDLGTEVNTSTLTNNYVYTIINERKMRNLPTVITTNLSLADIRDNYDERIYSRIADDTTIKIQLNGKDLRLKK